jgi:hypothetical protein
MVTIGEIEGVVAERIAALDGTAFNLTGLPAAVWRESRTPLSAISEPSALSHLLFSVSVESAPATEDGNDRDDYVCATLNLLVAFSFRIVATDQINNYRDASKAALDISRAVLAPCTFASFQPRQLYKPGPIVSGYMTVEVRFAVFCDVTLHRG